MESYLWKRRLDKMNTRPAFLSIIGLCLFGLLARAEQEIGFIEKFALAPVRNDVLGQLVPGTEEYYFYHALHYQNTAQKPKLAAILDQWAKRFPDSSQRRILENKVHRMPTSETIASIREYLIDKGLVVHFASDGERITVDATLKHVHITFGFSILEDLGLLQIEGSLPVVDSEDKKLAASDFFNRINWGLMRGRFVMDLVEGNDRGRLMKASSPRVFRNGQI